MDKLRALTVFVTVVERGSFAAAAEHLRLSRTAASRLVMDLETSLGTTLLNRTARRISMTQVGEAYLSRAKTILEQLDEADLQASKETSRLKERLRLSAPMSFGIRHLVHRSKQTDQACLEKLTQNQ